MSSLTVNAVGSDRPCRPPTARLLAALALTLAALAGCGDRPVSDPPRPDARFIWPKTIDKDIDLLFVVDNSGSMGEQQADLIANFPRLLDGLRHPRLGPDGSGKPCNDSERAGCNIPNLHIGVVSSDLGAGDYGLPSCEQRGGDDARLRQQARVAGCTPPKDPYIAYIDGQTNIPGASGASADVAKAFSCIAKLGVDGCGFEHPLEAARRALDPRLSINPGFVRLHAMLVVVLVTDEDDCSAERVQLFDPNQQGLTDPLGPLTSFRCFEFGVRCDVNDRTQPGPRTNCVPASDWLYDVKTRYVDFFRGLKPQGRLVFAAIAGPRGPVTVVDDGGKPRLDGACTSARGSAAPAIRIAAVVDALAPNSQLHDICEASQGPALQAIGRMAIEQLARSWP